MRPEQGLLRLRNLPWALIPFRQLPTLRNFGVVSMRQCSSYASVRVQRLLHLLQLYKLLYNERTVTSLLRNMYNRWYRQLLRPRLNAAFGSGLLMSATMFSFADNGINDEEMLRATDLLDPTYVTTTGKSSDRVDHRLATVREMPRSGSGGTAIVEQREMDSSSAWEPLITKEHFNLHRRPLRGNPALYEYRCAGTYTDITPTAFFIAQMDLEYRKQWDRLVISLDVIDSERNSGSEVVRWVTHFPYPMYPREYVYVRRACVDTRQGTFVLSSKSVDHPACPRDESKRVRVESYYSCMVVKAHGTVDENGFDYVLTYSDDPKAPFPQVAYNWMVNTGVLGFLDKVHNAAKALASKRSSASEQAGSAGAGQSVAYWQSLISERYNYSF